MRNRANPVRSPNLVSVIELRPICSAFRLPRSALKWGRGWWGREGGRGCGWNLHRSRRPRGKRDDRGPEVVTTPDDPAVGLFRALDALSPVPVDVLIHGTTIATNALLERRGARIALV